MKTGEITRRSFMKRLGVIGASIALAGSVTDLIDVTKVIATTHGPVYAGIADLKSLVLYIKSYEIDKRPDTITLEARLYDEIVGEMHECSRFCNAELMEGGYENILVLNVPILKGGTT